MEKRILQPEQIIVPGEYEVGNEAILKIYYRVFEAGQGSILPPAIVAHHGIASMEPLKRWFTSSARHIDDYQDKVREFTARGAGYFLLEGNHRSIAATLTRQGIPVLELQPGDDMGQLRRMVETGEMFDFQLDEETAELCAGECARYLTSKGFENMMTLRDRVDKLTSNGHLPGYMVEKYRVSK